MIGLTKIGVILYLLYTDRVNIMNPSLFSKNILVINFDLYFDYRMADKSLTTIDLELLKL